MITYAFIFARYGSKGVLKKNIKELVGKPLIVYSIALAKKIKAIDKVFVSTDDQTIAQIARQHGADVIIRPENLAEDDTPEWLAWQHAVEWLQKNNENFDVFLSLPATAPLRNTEDINSVLEALDENTDIVLTMTEAIRSPWYNIVRMSNEGFIEPVMSEDSTFHRRQDAPKAYDLTTVAYVTRPKYIKSASGLFEGRAKGVKIPPERALDIDSELDFEIAEFLMNKLNTAMINAK